ncbi:MAG TPA: hypothetical protein VID51_05320 [Solirubrobacterales bacterium]|jgi:hypothetical protein
MKYVTGTSKIWALLAVCSAAAVVGLGCGSSGESESIQREARQQAALEAQQRQQLREARRTAVRERHAAARRRALHIEAARRRARQLAARERAREESEALEEAEAGEVESSECDPSYSGACLDPYSSDYDCEGGSGDGPDYTGPVAVVGDDHYGLDSDSDGYACELS